MSDRSQITVRGRVGTDPEIVLIGSDREMTKFRLASTRSYRDAEGEWHETGTEWFTVKMWGPPGEMVRRSVRRGMPVIVQGTFSSEEWVSGDRLGHGNVITASTIGVDIRYGLVTHTRITRMDEPQNGRPANARRAGEDTDPTGPGEDRDDPEPAEPEPSEPDLAPPPVEPDDWQKVEVGR